MNIEELLNKYFEGDTSCEEERELRHFFTQLLSSLPSGFLHRHLNAMPDSYVIIDGKCYTDENLVREQAMAAFRNVSLDEDELLDSLFGE